MVLAVENLRMHLHLKRGVLRAVDGVSLEVGEGETLGLVGESGSGKTLTGLSLLRLLPAGSGRIVEGSIKLDGQELTTLSEAELARDIRGRRIAMIMQDPMTSLNPVFSIGDQVMNPLRNHDIARGRALRQAAVADLAKLNGNQNLPPEQFPDFLKANAAVHEAQRQLEHTIVRAPFAGTVTAVGGLQPGTLVMSAICPYKCTGMMARVRTVTLERICAASRL